MLVAQKLVGAIALFAVFLATALGGHRYYFCRAMGEVMTAATCACAGVRPANHVQASLQIENNCFELRSIDTLASFVAGASLVIQAAPLAAILPSLPALVPGSAAAVLRAERPIRAGPYWPTSSRAKLMVFLT